MRGGSGRSPQPCRHRQLPVGQAPASERRTPRLADRSAPQERRQPCGALRTRAQAGGAGASNQAPTTAGSSGMAQSCSVTTSPPWPDRAACRAASGSLLVGTWRARWPLVSVNDSFGADNTAVLTVSGLTADGTPCGTLRIGDGAPLPEATDPTAPYPPPPASPPASGMLLGPQFGSVSPDTYPGFAYSLVGVISDGTRLYPMPTLAARSDRSASTQARFTERSPAPHSTPLEARLLRPSDGRSFRLDLAAAHRRKELAEQFPPALLRESGQDCAHLFRLLGSPDARR